MIHLVLKKLPGPALCAESDPEHWFPTNESHPERSDDTDSANQEAAQAKAVCRRCTVRVECLAEAMDQKIDHGIWGGLSVRERKALRKRLTK